MTSTAFRACELQDGNMTGQLCSKIMCSGVGRTTRTRTRTSCYPPTVMVSDPSYANATAAITQEEREGGP